eukprot:CAMPEP_0172610638 /NCGR_PEP_ID=MMETSP1068-20121228/30412_1 /TAXON_ID=35684 /ORGANISM="Pseudopedinella elastica, Strain CCMP716" /LENGTH=396 /DNA_ID=CAMNT_0013414397 /DNA_START=267 /DNA_END=1457 /DNA_ORIENTATION=+
MKRSAGASGEEYTNPVTAFLGNFLPNAGTQSSGDADPDPLQSIDWDEPKAKGLRIEKLTERLDKGLREREWFVTGMVLPELFDDNFFFQDPDVKLAGIQKYGEGVRRLFDQEMSRAEVISCAVNSEADPTADATGVITVEWRLSGRVNLGPVGLAIKPYIVTTDLHVSGSTGLVIFQEDKFSIPPWDILLSAVAPGLPFLAPPAPPVPVPAPTPAKQTMSRPLLDQAASFLFKLENDRVSASSEVDEKGRVGEPMAWSEQGSLANQFSEVMAGPGYAFKQFVADVVAGDYDESEVKGVVDQHVARNKVAMFSFTTCPFCRRAKDELEERGIPYAVIELDERADGNALRAELGKRTRRTSVPSIFIGGQYIGGCNDGPGLIPLAESGELDLILAKTA